MGVILLFLSMISICCISLAKPRFGVISYYLLAILGPQYIWWWIFKDLRVSFLIAISTIVGISLKLLKGRYDLNFIFNKQSLCLAILWFFIIISYFFGPYVTGFRFSGIGPTQIFVITNNLFIFYFISSLEINKTFKLHYLMIIFVVSTIYMIYWANAQYFSHNWSQFSMGRLMGPVSGYGSSIYGDSNAFAMLLVCGLPFLYYLGWGFKNSWMRWVLWSIIPLGWHAIFLTGSRGGLVGLGAIMIFIGLLSRNKIYLLPMLIFFLLFYQWQAGDVMIERSEQIVNIEGERSASDRVTAWKGGLKMALDNPITGVGLGSFITALPDYTESRHMVAHNTFVQFAAESGVGAGLAYLVITILFLKHSISINRWCQIDVQKVEIEEIEEIHRIDLYNKASTVSFAGLSVCGLFLSLNIYEPFFVLLLFNNALFQISLKRFQPPQKFV